MEEARDYILRLWRSLPAYERTEDQAENVTAMLVQCLKSMPETDPYPVILRWIREEIRREQIHGRRDLV